MFQTVSDHSDKPTYSECCQSLRAKGYVNEEIWALMNWCAVRMIFWLNGLELASLHLAFTVLEGFVCSSSIGNSRWWVSQSFWKCVCSSKPSHVVKQLTTREWCWWLIQWKLSEGPTFMDLQSVSWHGFSVSHTQCSWYLVRSFQSVLRSLAGILSEVFSEDMNREEKHIEWDLLACVVCIVSRWRFPVFTCIMHQQQTRGGGGTHRTISSGLCVRE